MCAFDPVRFWVSTSMEILVSLPAGSIAKKGGESQRGLHTALKATRLGHSKGATKLVLALRTQKLSSLVKISFNCQSSWVGGTQGRPGVLGAKAGDGQN